MCFTILKIYFVYSPSFRKFAPTPSLFPFIKRGKTLGKWTPRLLPARGEGRPEARAGIGPRAREGGGRLGRTSHKAIMVRYLTDSRISVSPVVAGVFSFRRMKARLAKSTLLSFVPLLDTKSAVTRPFPSSLYPLPPPFFIFTFLFFRRGCYNVNWVHMFE